MTKPRKLSAGIACSRYITEGKHGYAHAFITEDGKPYLNLCDSCYEAWAPTHDQTKE